MSTVDYNSVSNKYTKLKDVFLSADYVKAEYIEELSNKLSVLNETVTANLNARLTVNDLSANENNNINLNVLRPAPGEGDIYKEYLDSSVTFLTDDAKLTKELVVINNDTAVYSLLNATQYILAGTNNGLYYSADNGKTWEQSNTLNDVLVKNLKTYNGRFYACTNAGLYESLNGTTWDIYSDPMAGARLSLERDNITDIIQFKKAQSKITIATTSTGYIKFFNESTKDNPRYFILNNNNYNIRTIIEHKDYIYIADEFYVYKISKQTILDAIRHPDQSMAIENIIFDITSIRNNSINDIAIINDILYVCTSNNGILYSTDFYSTDFRTFTKIIDTNNVARNLSDTNNFDYIKIANNKIYAAAISKQTIYIFDSASVVPTEKPLLLNNVTSIFDFIFIDNYYMLLGTNAGVYHIQQLDDITLVKDKIITQTQLDAVITEITETFNNEINKCEKLSTFNTNHLALGSGTYDYELNKHDNVVALGTNVECDANNDIAIGNNLKLTNGNSIVIGNNITVDKPDTTILATTTNDEYIKLILTLDNNDDLSGKPYFILKTNDNDEEQIKEISLSGHTHSINDVINLNDTISVINNSIDQLSSEINSNISDITQISSYFDFGDYGSFDDITNRNYDEDTTKIFPNIKTISSHINKVLGDFNTSQIDSVISNLDSISSNLDTNYYTKEQVNNINDRVSTNTTNIESLTTSVDIISSAIYNLDYNFNALNNNIENNYYTSAEIDSIYASKNYVMDYVKNNGGSSGGNTNTVTTTTNINIPANSNVNYQSRNIGDIFFTLNEEDVGESYGSIINDETKKAYADDIIDQIDKILENIDSNIKFNYNDNLFIINKSTFKGAVPCTGNIYIVYDLNGDTIVDAEFTDLINAFKASNIISVGFDGYYELSGKQNGIVGKFGWNNGIIIAPNLVGNNNNGTFLQAANANIGTYKSSGLPNIKGKVYGGPHSNTTIDPNGEITNSALHYDNADVWVGNGTSKFTKVGNTGAYVLNASWHNSIYGKSSIVQPPAINCIPMIQICNFTIQEKNNTNTTAIATIADETTNTRITQLESEIETLKEQLNLLINK